MAIRIDGKAIAADIRAEMAVRAQALKDRGMQPCLAVILAGEDPASKIYVRNKRRACKEVGIESRAILLPEEVTEAETEAPAPDGEPHFVTVDESYFSDSLFREYLEGEVR